MSEAHALVSHAVKVALLVLLGGLLVRGRVRHCWVFPIYLTAAFLGNCLPFFWPERFYTPQFWVLKQTAYDILKMLIAVELAWRAFRCFPGALATARVVGFVLIAGSTLFILRLTPPSSYLTLWDWQPGTLTASIWLFTATALLVVWYQVPVHDLQRAILLGFAPYLLAFVITLDILRRRGWEARELASLLDATAYLALISFWAWVAWRREAPDRAPVIAASPRIA